MSPSGRWRSLLSVVGAAALLFVAYGHVLTCGPYGINDDYQYLTRTQARNFDPGHNELMGMGRPVMAWGVQAAYGLCAGNVPHLVWLRLAALVGVGGFAALLFRVLADLGYGRSFALTVAALVALTPACGVYAAWAAGAFAPWALCCALGGGWLLVRPRVGWRSNLAAGGLVVLACANWQAAAPMAMFPALADAWTHTDGRRRSSAARWWRPWLVGALAVGCYGVFCVLMARYGAVNAGGVTRLSLAHDLSAKAAFLAAILRTGVTSWARLQVGPWEWVVGIGTTLAGGRALPAWRDGRLRASATASRAGLAVFVVLLSVAPLLVVREDNGAFRSLICLYVAVTFLGVLGVRRLLARAPGWTRVALATAAVAGSVGAARYHVWHGLVEPNLREYVGVRDQVRRQFPDGAPSHLVYLVPPFTPPLTGRLTPSWEYGLTSSPFWWVTRPFLVLAFADALPGRLVPPDLRISYREAGNPGVPVLQSLPALLRDPGEWRDDARWGRVCAFRGGWLYSPWFGYLDAGSFPFVRHHLLGGLMCTDPELDERGLCFFHDGLGRFHTSAEEYPLLRLAGAGRRVTLSDDNPMQISLSDDETHERLPYPP